MNQWRRTFAQYVPKGTMVRRALWCGRFGGSLFSQTSVLVDDLPPRAPVYVEAL